MEESPESHDYHLDLVSENEELSSKEYLGTFRWKRSLKFPLLNYTQISEYLVLTNWADYISTRSQFEMEPYIIDALSYPLSIIYSLETLRKNEKLNSFLKETTVNLIIMGASNKTECRIALESNYFDEIFVYLSGVSTAGIKLHLNIYFLGEEVKFNSSFTSKNFENMRYIFSQLNTGDFLKENALNFSKNDTIAIGLNCGFGAGYLKLTLSWIYDLIKLLKFGYIMIFTYTNDYEDKKGEMVVMEEIIGGKILLQLDDNPFKSMTVYQSPEAVENSQNLWSCGNFGIYIVHGYNKEKLTKLLKVSGEEMSKIIKEHFESNNVQIK